MRNISIQPRVDRDTYFTFKAMCHAHGVSVGQAIEELMRSALERAGVSVVSGVSAVVDSQAK